MRYDRGMGKNSGQRKSEDGEHRQLADDVLYPLYRYTLGNMNRECCRVTSIWDFVPGFKGGPVALFSQAASRLLGSADPIIPAQPAEEEHPVDAQFPASRNRPQAQRPALGSI